MVRFGNPEKIISPFVLLVLAFNCAHLHLCIIHLNRGITGKWRRNSGGNRKAAIIMSLLFYCLPYLPPRLLCSVLNNAVAFSHQCVCPRLLLYFFASNAVSKKCRYSSKQITASKCQYDFHNGESQGLSLDKVEGYLPGPLLSFSFF